MTKLSLVFITLISNFTFAADKKSDNFCVKDDLTYSIGSIIKSEDGKIYICHPVHLKNMKEGVAWVEVESIKNVLEKN